MRRLPRTLIINWPQTHTDLSSCVNSPTVHHPGQALQTIAYKGAVNGGTGSREAVVALEIPGNSLRSKVVYTPKMEIFFNYLWRKFTRMA